MLITYPETSPFAAYAVKIWKHKTKVIWSDAGLYQYTKYNNRNLMSKIDFIVDP